MSKPRVVISVIVVVYNGANTLQSCLDSICGQTYSDFEIVIIDGGSSDRTIDIVRKNEGLINYWVSEPDNGIYDAMNKGISAAKGDWIIFIGADDYLFSNETFQVFTDCAQAEPELCKLVYGRVAQIDSMGKVINLVGEPWMSTKKQLKYRMSLSHQSIFLHKSWFESYGVFDPTYKISGDYELLLRGWPIEEAIFIPDLIVAKVGQDGVSSNPKNSMKQLREIIKAQRVNRVCSLNIFMIMMWFRIAVRLGMQYLLGDMITRHFLDFGRVILGKEKYWTKL